MSAEQVIFPLFLFDFTFAKTKDLDIDYVQV